MLHAHVSTSSETMYLCARVRSRFVRVRLCVCAGARARAQPARSCVCVCCVRSLTLKLRGNTYINTLHVCHVHACIHIYVCVCACIHFIFMQRSAHTVARDDFPISQPRSTYVENYGNVFYTNLITRFATYKLTISVNPMI